MSSKTGSMALREAEVQPPKTAATQSSRMSFSAFSANTVGSDAPSSATISISLPCTPPAALISSTARVMASRTVVSEMAMVPERELRAPTLMVSPEVSTQDSAAAVSSPAREPHAAVATRPVMAAVAARVRARCLALRRSGMCS